MKKYILAFVFILSLAIVLPGCYTVIWNPSMQFPNKENSQAQNNGYYDSPYYGNYYYYYDYPWWYSLPQNFYQPITQQTRNRNSEISNIRNNSGGRGTPERNPIIQTTNPSRSENSNTTTTSAGNSSSNNSSNGGMRVEGQNNTQNNSRSSNSNSSLRNNDGGRNTNGRK